MSWDSVWDSVFSSQAWGKYPQEELIRFVARRFYSAADRRSVSILDAGCGPGAGVWYLAREGFDAHGVDASAVAVAQARARLEAEGLSADVRVGDLVGLAELYGSESFDAVLDITSTQHNHPDVIELVYAQIRELLRPGGRVFAMMVTRGSWGSGREIGPGTLVDITEGPLHRKGLTHFADREDIDRFFAGFESLQVDTSERTLDGGRQRYGHWVVEAVRPA